MNKNKFYEMNKIATAYFYRQMLETENRQGLDYWQNERNLDSRTIKKYGLGFAKDDWQGLTNYLRSFRDSNNQRVFSDEEIFEAGLAGRSEKGNLYDKFRNRAIIPICDTENNIIGFGGRTLLTADQQKQTNTPKYLNSADSPAFHKGENLFSLNQALRTPAPQMILCEGYLDVISLNKAGFSTAVASLGTSLTAEQVKLICDNASEVIIAYDNDEAGQTAIRKAIGMFEGKGINVRIWQTDDKEVKDTDAYINKYGAERMQVLIDKAVDSEIFLIDYMLKQPNTTTLSAFQYIADLDCSDEKKQMYFEHIADELNLPPEMRDTFTSLKYDFTEAKPVFPVNNEQTAEVDIPF